MSRKTIYMSDATKTYLENRSDHTGIPKSSHSLSKAINIVIDRYAEVITKNIPELEINEWHLIVDALKGIWSIEPVQNTLTMIAGKVEEALSNPKTASKYGVDIESLRAKLQDLSMEQKFALIDVAEVFWLGLKIADPDMDDEGGLEQALAISKRVETGLS